MIEELRTAAEAVLEDQPPDPNAVELALLVIKALDAGLVAASALEARGL